MLYWVSNVHDQFLNECLQRGIIDYPIKHQEFWDTNHELNMLTKKLINLCSIVSRKSTNNGTALHYSREVTTWQTY